MWLYWGETNSDGLIFWKGYEIQRFSFIIMISRVAGCAVLIGFSLLGMDCSLRVYRDIKINQKFLIFVS